MMGVDKDNVRRSFSRAAACYADNIKVQRGIGVRLGAFASLYQPPDKTASVRILDAGCGSCFHAAQLAHRFPNHHITGLDFSEPMLRERRHRIGAGAKADYVCGDFESLPFSDNAFDLIYSSSALQWSDDLRQGLNELRRCLRDDGLLLLSSYGPATLCELGASWERVDQYKHTLDFLSGSALGQLLESCGFKTILNQRQFEIVFYDSVRGLLRALQRAGIKNWRTNHRRSLTHPSWLRTMETHYYNRYAVSDKIPATYEILLFVAN